MKIINQITAYLLSAIFFSCLFYNQEALAASSAGKLLSAQTNITDQRALRNGAKLFTNYCLSCHGAQYMRYSRVANDLNISEEDMLENLVFAGEKIGETMTVAMANNDAKKWLQQTPPDLSVIARAKGPGSTGSDWLYTFLKSFYKDPSKATGWNNLLAENTSMPHVLWNLQGIQELSATPNEDQHHPNTKSLKLTQDGILSPEEYDQNIRDLVTFLEYVGEPSKLERKAYGPYVLLYLALLALITYFLKQEYWRDVH